MGERPGPDLSSALATLLVLSRFYHFLRGPNPLHPKVWTGRLSRLSFRRFVPEDLKQCLELYALNEHGRFPTGYGKTYEDSLTKGTAYHLVAERDGQILASGGVTSWIYDNLIVFCFGLVHPEHQRKGIGTTLLLTRLALLKPDRNYVVCIFAVQASIGFYRRFGFLPFTPWKDPNGDQRPSAQLRVTMGDIQGCRDLLAKHQIVWPSDADRIPMHSKEQYLEKVARMQTPEV